MTKMTEEKDIFGRMIDMGLEMVILDHVLKQLDSESITNARLTCHKWRNLIDLVLWNTNSGKKYLNVLLKNNFMYNEPNVSTITLNHQIYDLNWDQDAIVVIIKIDNNNYKVMCFNTHTLGLRWENDTDYIGEQYISLVHGFNDYAIFVLSNSGIISVLRRSDGHCLCKFDTSSDDIFKSMVLVWKNRLVFWFFFATKNENENEIEIEMLGKHCMKFYDVDFAAPNVLQMTQSVDNLGRTFSMDNDKKDLISCSTNGQLILWNFQTGEKVQTLETNDEFDTTLGETPTVSFKRPYVVMFFGEDYKSGIKIYNIEMGTMIHDLSVLGWTYIHLTNMWLMITCQGEDDDDSTLEVFDWHDLLQGAVAQNPVPKRSIKVDNCTGDARWMCGENRNAKTKIITGEGTNIVVRKFWP
jgi:WD40 repeat protein